MRATIFLAALTLSCATTSDQQRPASADRASTTAVDALTRGDYAEALARADDGLRRHPEDAWLLYNRGLALAGMNRLEEAFDTLRHAERRFDNPHDKSLAVYRRALSLEFAGRCAEASTELSHYAALVQAQEPKLADEAMNHVTFCLQPTPQQVAEREEIDRLASNASDARIQKAEAASTAAVHLLVIGDYGAALKEAQAGLAILPNDPWLLYNVGTALAGLGRFDDALPVLRDAERGFSSENIHGRSVAVYRRAITLEFAGRCDEAAAEMKYYSEMVQPSQPQLAQHALTHATFCRIANGRKTF